MWDDEFPICFYQIVINMLLMQGIHAAKHRSSGQSGLAISKKKFLFLSILFDGSYLWDLCDTNFSPMEDGFVYFVSFHSLLTRERNVVSKCPMEDLLICDVVEGCNLSQVRVRDEMVVEIANHGRGVLFTSGRAARRFLGDTFIEKQDDDFNIPLEALPKGYVLFLSIRSIVQDNQRDPFVLVCRSDLVKAHVLSEGVQCSNMGLNVTEIEGTGEDDKQNSSLPTVQKDTWTKSPATGIELYTQERTIPTYEMVQLQSAKLVEDLVPSNKRPLTQPIEHTSMKQNDSLLLGKEIEGINMDGNPHKKSRASIDHDIHQEARDSPKSCSGSGYSNDSRDKMSQQGQSSTVGGRNTSKKLNENSSGSKKVDAPILPAGGKEAEDLELRKWVENDGPFAIILNRLIHIHKWSFIYISTRRMQDLVVPACTEEVYFRPNRCRNTSGMQWGVDCFHSHEQLKDYLKNLFGMSKPKR